MSKEIVWEIIIRSVLNQRLNPGLQFTRLMLQSAKLSEHTQPFCFYEIISITSLETKHPVRILLVTGVHFRLHRPGLSHLKYCSNTWIKLLKSAISRKQFAGNPAIGTICVIVCNAPPSSQSTFPRDTRLTLGSPLKITLISRLCRQELAAAEFRPVFSSFFPPAGS